jgi:hypothetical protein
MIKKTTLQDIYYWSRFQSDRGIDFNGFLWTRPDGNVLLDPMDLSATELAAVREKGGARWIVLTNFDHLRDAVHLKHALGAELLAPAGDRGRFGTTGTEVDLWFEGAGDLPPELREAIAVHPLRGGKSPVELALFLRGPDALLFGDLVRSHVSGELMLLPDPKLADKAAAIESLQPLRALPIQGLLLGDGDCIFYHAKEAFTEFLEELAR